MVTADDAARYLKQYIESYRREYQRFIAPPPEGGGYQDLQVSPFLYSTRLFCFLTNNGAVVADFSSWQPSYQWHIVGGPALMVDTPESRTPPWVAKVLKSKGIGEEHTGISRIVAQGGLLDEVWRGQFPEPREAAEEHANGTQITVSRYDTRWTSLIKRLTYGAFCNILDIHLPSSDSPFWRPLIVRDLGFLTADRQHKTFYHYLEFLPHVEKAAWDSRSIQSRVFLDIHRDYAYVIGMSDREGATISWGGSEPLMKFRDHLSALEDAIREFELLLDTRSGEDEAVFHEFLETNPVLLDVYGELVSKPRFFYPEGESPLGKAYVEPDFVVRYPGDRYKLVELEKPGKEVTTGKGQPRAEVSQAAFQIAEWKDYIRNHYESIKEQFPGISVNCTSMVVIGRASEESIGSGRDVRRYMQMVSQNYAVDEVLLYDDLLARANQAYVRLQSLTIPSG